jgi:hypothetical protein
MTARVLTNVLWGFLDDDGRADAVDTGNDRQRRLQLILEAGGELG